MCCGQRIVADQQAQAQTPQPTWSVLDGAGTEIMVKTSLIAAKLAAARVNGSVVENRP